MEIAKRITHLPAKSLLLPLACGVADEEARLAIMAAVADWEDADNLLHLDGAESDYYAGLSVPYACKNAPMEHIEELLLVRGVTPSRAGNVPRQTHNI